MEKIKIAPAAILMEFFCFAVNMQQVTVEKNVMCDILREG